MKTVYTYKNELEFLSARFGYCRNTVPISASKINIERCEHIAERAATHFGLADSNGVDFILSRERLPTVFEIGPVFREH